MKARFGLAALLVYTGLAAACLALPDLDPLSRAGASTDAGDGEAGSCANALAGGMLNGTRFDTTNNSIALVPGTQSGSFVSRVFDMGSPRAWSSLQWSVTRPISKELPDNGAIETGYAAGNADMSKNVFLTHLNERQGELNFANSSGKGTPTGTCLGASCPSPDVTPFVRGARFNGAQAVRFLNHADFEPPASFTVASWVRLDGRPNGTTTAMLITKGHASPAPFTSYSIEYDYTQQPNRFKCYANIGGVGRELWSAHTYAIPSASWYHVACTYDGSSLRIIVNGVLEGSISVAGAVTYGLTDDQIYLGSWGTGSQQLVGALDEVAIFSTALPELTIRDHYRRGALALDLQVRACDDPSCTSETNEGFVGSTGTGASAYSELCRGLGAGSTSASPRLDLIHLDCDRDGQPDDGIGRAVAVRRYVQLQARLKTDIPNESPELLGFSLCY